MNIKKGPVTPHGMTGPLPLETSTIFSTCQLKTVAKITSLPRSTANLFQ